mmetsp:Transcript_53469/g.153427  ORF Transcript_53469/g.153427 Transcript_53469/m.153427 type:complete len:347 (-) Transcript_53469:23-1063(-)
MHRVVSSACRPAASRLLGACPAAVTWRPSALVLPAALGAEDFATGTTASASVVHRRFATSSAFGAAAALSAAVRARRHGRSVLRARRRGAGAVQRSAGDGTMETGSDAAEDELSQKLRLALERFEAEVNRPDGEINLPRAAALLTLHADPGLDVEALVHEPFSRLRADFRAYVDAANLVPLEEVPEALRLYTLAASLCAFMAKEGFTGCERSDSTYYRAENSLMNRVLERRCGIPITLSIAYIVVGEAVGLELRGVNFPGHFLLAFGRGTSTGLVDAFENTVVPQDQAEQIVQAVGGVLPRIPNTVFLMRMLGNLQGVYERDGNFAPAARIVQYARRLEAAVAAFR